MSIEIPKDHPRYQSLINREKIIDGMHSKVVAPAGLIAHGRGEAFDYLMGEKTLPCARRAIRQAAYAFLTAKHPVISVNGNVAALCPELLVKLSEISSAPLEINLFYREQGREEAIEKVLREHGAKNILGTAGRTTASIPELSSNRRHVDPDGILISDCVFVPLEDGDRTEALVRMGKTVITVDLNPLSRTARMASISITDNIIRALPLLIEDIKNNKNNPKALSEDYDNKEILSQAVRAIAEYLTDRAKNKDF
ncbi:4-phosphopantoate--beta-alanine ligase [Spirochaetia bacterium 38H-sp]|uniref:4-phosphopantoate--beta-alanine ligase n=1 Tax=Rarispira pelagica TaxID=3141764 RepID=A0ABU9UA98_9SPIR